MQPVEIAELFRGQLLALQSRMVRAVAVGAEHAVGHAELGRNYEGAHEFPHYLVAGGYLEQPARKALGYQGIAVGQALRPSGEVSEKGDPR